EDAGGWLDSSIKGAVAGQWSVLEGYARKDRAALYLAEDRLEEAEVEAARAEDLFASGPFPEAWPPFAGARGGSSGGSAGSTRPSGGSGPRWSTSSGSARRPSRRWRSGRSPGSGATASSPGRW